MLPRCAHPDCSLWPLCSPSVGVRLQVVVRVRSLSMLRLSCMSRRIDVDDRAGQELDVVLQLGEAAEVFELLANPVRLSLMHALAHHGLTVGDLACAGSLAVEYESPAGAQRACSRKRKHEPGAAILKGVTDEHCDHGEQAEKGQSIDRAASDTDRRC